MKRTRTTWGALAVLLAVAAVGTSALLPTAPTAADEIDLSFTIPTASAASASGSGGGSTSGGSSSGTGGSTASNGNSGSATSGSTSPVADAVADAGAQLPTAAIDERTDLGGALYIGGVSTEVHPSIDPLNGDLSLQLSVRNVTDAPVSVKARFWMEGIFGNHIGAESTLPVTIQAGETMPIHTSLSGVGQWTFLTGHVTLTPTSQVNGVDMRPINRDAFAFALPWLVVVLALIAAWVALFILRRNDALRLQPSVA